MSKQITAIIVGAGHRSLIYAEYALLHPDELKIVGVADPDPVRRRMTAEKFGFGDTMCFESAQQLAARGKLADAIINGTMDSMHVPTAIPLIECGYDMLLEKPMAITEKDMFALADTVKRTGRKVFICHVLRYSPFYATIRQRILSGELGEIINIQLTEHVSYDHVSMAYVRGKWNSEEKCGSGMLLAKCSHDMDLMMWLMGTQPVSVSSFGSDLQFSHDKKPAGAGTRCLKDCPIENDCPYSCKKQFIDRKDNWGVYVWAGLEGKQNLTDADKLSSLKTDNPYGRCVWECDNDVVDHQTVLVNFVNGATSTLNMIGGSARAERDIHVIGTRGEIKGVLNDAAYVVRRIDNAAPDGYTEEKFDLSALSPDSHGGGDLRLVEDFVHVLQGEEPSISCTSVENSVYGHLAVFRAETARRNGTVEPLTV